VRDATATIINDASGILVWQTVDVFFKREIGSGRSAEGDSFSWLLEKRKQPETARLLSVEILSANGNIHRGNEQDFGSAAAFGFFLDCLSSAAAGNNHDDSEGERDDSVVACRLVVPRSSGYIVRSDILSLRLIGCELVDSVVSFAKPQQYFDGKTTVDSVNVVSNAFAASIGGILLTIEKKNKGKTRQQHLLSNGAANGISNGLSPSSTLDSLLASLDDELRNRLSFPWLSSQIPHRRPTLAIVDGGLRGPDDGGTGGSIYMAAEALGIDMVVLDNPGHWVNGPKYRHWRKAFVPLELQLEPDPGFADRIAAAVRSYEGGHIDGILTCRDHYKLPVAEAAVQLCLPTYPPSAYAIATDKFKTSVSEGHAAFQATSAEEALQIVREQQHSLTFPLLIKPCNGFLSEGVFRAESLSHLEAGARALDRFDADRHGRDFVIEKYCEGPEVDANVVLCDGEVVFFELSDDFPKSGDAKGSGRPGGDVNSNFLELANVLPSALPDGEQAMLRDELRKSLLRMGFRDGFYHLEARVEDSSMEYATKGGILDLRERAATKSVGEEEAATATPSSWLIEVNPRPPGIQASEAVRYTYGVDFFGLALLFALNDKDRARRLSHAFSRGPQYWCEMVFIPVEGGGVFDSGDVCEELFGRRPDLADHVSACFCFLRRGDRVSDPARTGLNSWVAYFNVFSRESRAHVLELADRVRQEVTFSIRPDNEAVDYTTRIFSRPPTNTHSPVLCDADLPHRSISWADYASAVKRIAVGLRALGVAEGDAVGLISRNDIYYWVLADGAIAAGATFVPVPPSDKQERLAAHFTVAQVKWLFVAPEFLDFALATAASAGMDTSRVLLFDPPGLEPSERNWKQPSQFSSLLDADESLWQNPNRDKDPATLTALRLFTSGTTGSIKAAELSHSALVTRLDAQDFVPSPRDTAQLQYISLASAGGQMICQRAVAGGLPAYISNYDDEISIIDRIQSCGISVVQLPPRTMEAITAVITKGIRPRESLASLNTILVGGATSRKEGVDQFAAVLPSHVLLRSGYGSTEVGIIAMTPADPDKPWRPGPGYAGVLPPGVELRIIDHETLQTVSSSTEGEICVRTSSMFSGYCNNPTATAEVFLKDENDTGKGGEANPWFRTGDRGYLDPQTGQLALTGRFNEMFTAKLDRVVPAEVEAELLRHPSIADAAVTATRARDIEGDNECVAYIVRRDGKEHESLTAQEVVKFAAERLSRYKAPTGGVVFCESIPRNAMRKVMRHSLAGLEELPGSARYLDV